jgi:hypothetical protein
MLLNKRFIRLWMIFFLGVSVASAEESSPAFRAYGFYASQKTGGDLVSGGVSWNPRILAMGSFLTGGVLGVQLLKDQSGTLVPALDFGLSIALRVASEFRVESQFAGVVAPFEGSSLQGSLSSSSAAVGLNLLWDRRFWVFDGVWVGGRQWLAADSVTEYRIGGSFSL